MKNIVLTGGGTIGHTAPHFAITPHLNFDNVYYIGSSKGMEKEFVKNKNIPYFEIDPIKLHRSFTFENLKIPFKFIKSVNDSKEILKKLKPNVVFSKGGFVGLPVTIAARKLNIPVIIHESDLTVGLANKIASRFADKTLTTFYNTSKTVKNGEYVGAIIREELFKIDKKTAKEKFKIKTNKPVLLITGGSMGAKAINQLVINSLHELTKKFFVFHIVGKGNLTGIKNSSYYEIEFADMSYVYPLADVVVSRAGSGTAFELATLNIPTLFIPLPKTASRGDQIENASYFKRLNLADMTLQEDLSTKTFIDKILNLYKNKSVYKNNLKRKNFPIANKKIADILNKY